MKFSVQNIFDILPEVMSEYQIYTSILSLKTCIYIFLDKIEVFSPKIKDFKTNLAIGLGLVIIHITQNIEICKDGTPYFIIYPKLDRKITKTYIMP